MANGVLGKAAPLTDTNTSVYQVPVDTFSVVSINICNRGATSTLVNIGICAGTTPNTDEFIEFETEILANGVLERTGIVVGAEQYVIVRCSTGDTTAMVYGIETPTA